MIPSMLRYPGETAENAIDAQEQVKLVKRGSNSDQVALTTAATDVPIGVIGSSRSAGQEIQVLGDGFYQVIADGAVSQGDRLVPSGSTDGAVQASEDKSETFVGFALKAASDGDAFWAYIEVRPDDLIRIMETIDTGSEGDQATDAFDVDLQQNLQDSDRWIVKALEDDGSLSTDIQISSQGNETFVTAGGNAREIFDLGGSGDATIRFLDSSGTKTADVHIVLIPVNEEGREEQFTLTYS